MDKPYIKKLSPYELVEVYQPTKKLLKELLEIEYKKLENLKKVLAEIDSSIDGNRAYSYKTSEDMKWLLGNIYSIIPQVDVANSIQFYKKLIDIRTFQGNKLKYNNDGGVCVDKAKDRPISDYLEFNRAHKVNCIWHDEKTPSLYYDAKRNRVHCFGCEKGGDVIDVVQKLYSKTFLEAVDLILNK